MEKSQKRQALSPWARTATIEALDRVLQKGAPADRAITETLNERRIEPADERWQARRKLQATLAARARLGWWLRRIAVPDTPVNLLAAHEVMMRGVSPEAALTAWRPAEPERRATSSQLLSAFEPLAGAAIDHPEMDTLAALECPAAYKAPLRRALGDAMAMELRTMQTAPERHLRVNTLKGDVASAMRVLESEGIVTRPTNRSPIGLRILRGPDIAGTQAFLSGYVEVQDEGSQLAALLLGAEPGERVLDLCAGAGGKTLALAAAMANKGQIGAVDRTEGRLQRARQRARRAGANNILFHYLDTDGRKWLKRQRGRFDAVLIDAPCSGTGAWRRNPDARWTRPIPDLAGLAETQDRLLADAARLVRPGGRILYVTCSLLVEENEDRVAAFLAAHPDFAPANIAVQWNAVAVGPCPANDGPVLRLTPARHGTDGFGIACLRRDSVTH